MVELEVEVEVKFDGEERGRVEMRIGVVSGIQSGYGGVVF